MDICIDCQKDNFFGGNTLRESNSESCLYLKTFHTSITSYNMH